MLEQIAYEGRSVQVQRQVYQILDLESLSAVSLYSESKDYSKGNEENLNFYSWLNIKKFGETDFYLQEEGESHKEFKGRLKGGGASGGTISSSGNFTSGSGY